MRGTSGLVFAAAASLAVGVIGGGVTGIAVGWMTKPDVRVEVPRELTAEELASACAQSTGQADDPLTTAQNKVSELERSVAERERQVGELEAQMAKNATKNAKLASDLAAARTALAEQKSALEAAVLEKEELLGKLSLVSDQLAEKELLLDAAKDEIVSGRWQDFLNEAVLEICDKGNRKKLGDCRSVVSSTLGTNARAAKYTHCLRSGQAAPMVREWTAEGGLPPFAEPLDDAQKEVRGWVVIFCDPTLPEMIVEPIEPTEPG